jgi:DNA polymerase delta subunit 1
MEDYYKILGIQYNASITDISNSFNLKMIDYKCLPFITDKDKVEGSPLCINCQSKEGEIYLQKLEQVNNSQQLFSQLWTECQRCQGSFHQEVICTNRDCPIFYKRKKVQIDLQAAQEALDKFSW